MFHLPNWNRIVMPLCIRDQLRWYAYGTNELHEENNCIEDPSSDVEMSSSLLQRKLTDW